VRTALSIGCTGRRCYDGDAVEQPPAPFHATCGSCGKEFNTFRRGGACAACCKNFNNGKFHPRFVFQFTRNHAEKSAARARSAARPAANQQSLGDLQSGPAFLREACAFIRSLDERVGETAYLIGQKLIEVKKRVKHGAYESFVVID
jgi:hypothetical protein